MTATKAALKKSTWNTFGISAYTHDVANDQRSAGGVHCHQVRKAKSGWQKRIRQSNGKYESFGEVSPISDADGEAFFATAQSR